MRVLVYGFGPYKDFKRNITQDIVRDLPRSTHLAKIVFPVHFNKSQFINAVKKSRPDFILGLGQCSKGRLLRIERRAINKRQNHKRQKARPIVRGGARWLPTTLRLEKLALGKQTKMSHNAGDYVCNFSMYLILDYLRRHRREARFGFVHVPYRYDPKIASRIVKKVLKSLETR